MSKSKLQNHPYREWLIHLAGGDVKKAIGFLTTEKVPLKNVIDMFRYFSGVSDIVKLRDEATSESLNQVESALPFIRNKSKSGEISKRKKADTFPSFKKLVNSCVINLQKSYKWNNQRMKKNNLNISQRTYYNYRNDMKQ